MTARDYKRRQQKMIKLRKELGNESTRAYFELGPEDPTYLYINKAYGDVYQACIKLGV